MKYYIIPAEKIEKRLEFLHEKGSETRVGEIHNIIGYGKEIELNDDIKDL